jgi:hypothetical protein
MKYFKIICMSLLLFAVCSAFSFPFLKPKSNVVYAFGVAASFKDTVVYFTDIQPLDSVKLIKGFLPNRSSYSSQLKNYLETSKQKEHQTCMIFFGKDITKLQKQEYKLNKLYRKDKITIIPIHSSEFKFTKPEDEGNVEVVE